MRKVSYYSKLCFIETKLKQSYDLQGYFLKIKETINALTNTVIIFLNEHFLEAVVRKCPAKIFLKFHKIYFAFQEVARLVERPNRHILEILLVRRHTFVAQNRPASVRLHHILSFRNNFG